MTQFHVSLNGGKAEMESQVTYGVRGCVMLPFLQTEVPVVRAFIVLENSYPIKISWSYRVSCTWSEEVKNRDPITERHMCRNAEQCRGWC